MDSSSLTRKKIKFTENETFTEPLRIFTMISKYENGDHTRFVLKLTEGRGDRFYQTLG